MMTRSMTESAVGLLVRPWWRRVLACLCDWIYAVRCCWDDLDDDEDVEHYRPL